MSTQHGEFTRRRNFSLNLPAVKVQNLEFKCKDGKGVPTNGFKCMVYK
jgi:hypothetical protein